jgi:hypothetical protein
MRYYTEYAELVEHAWDTIISSHERSESAVYYVDGENEPHFPVPAVQTRVRFGRRHIDISVIRYKIVHCFVSWAYWSCVRLWTN